MSCKSTQTPWTGIPPQFSRKPRSFSFNRPDDLLKVTKFLLRYLVCNWIQLIILRFFTIILPFNSFPLASPQSTHSLLNRPLLFFWMVVLFLFSNRLVWNFQVFFQNLMEQTFLYNLTSNDFEKPNAPWCLLWRVFQSSLTFNRRLHYWEKPC